MALHDFQATQNFSWRNDDSIVAKPAAAAKETRAFYAWELILRKQESNQQYTF